MNNPILLINHDRSFRQNIRLLLENHAFDCREADDAMEALALLDGGIMVDGIVSDYHLPPMGGLDFLKALAYRVNGKDIPVIFVSENSTKEMQRQAEEAGAFGFLSNPYQPREILNLVSRALGQ